MEPNRNGAGGEGLERSCEADAADWIRQTRAVGGVEWFEARLRRSAYRRHRHDVYAIGLTDAGVQAFAYRGASHVSAPGQVVVLHPDEAHDGRAGADAGFGYRQLYVEPALIFEAVRAMTGRVASLPFVRQPVTTNPILAAAIRTAFRDGPAPLAIDDLIVRLAEGLLAADPDAGHAPRSPRLDLVAIDRARDYLDATTNRVVTSAELEAASGLSRFDLARQFRAVVGTSPYRYSLMRRLARGRDQIACGRPLVAVALDAGFADQAHFTRMFAAAFGFTPGQYRKLTAHKPSS
jgi:AraC-like DNA-binding protein